jgi:hypothetical protein
MTMSKWQRRGSCQTLRLHNELVTISLLYKKVVRAYVLVARRFFTTGQNQSAHNTSGYVAVTMFCHGISYIFIERDRTLALVATNHFCIRCSFVSSCCSRSTWPQRNLESRIIPRERTVSREKHSVCRFCHCTVMQVHCRWFHALHQRVLDDSRSCLNSTQRPAVSTQPKGVD